LELKMLYRISNIDNINKWTNPNIAVVVLFKIGAENRFLNRLLKMTESVR